MKVLSRYLTISFEEMADGTHVDGGETENLSADHQPQPYFKSDIPRRTNYRQLCPGQGSGSSQMLEVYHPLSGNLQVV
jgi:hypothetical protein